MFSKKDLAAEAYRELTKRRECYPRWILQKKITQEDADRKIALQEAIYRVLVNVADADVKLAQ